MKIAGLILCSVLLLWGIGCAFTSCHVVPPGHRGVSVTLGSVDQNIRGEGFTLKKPWPFERVEDVPIQQGRMDGSAECFSSDLQTVRVQFVVRFRRPEAKVAELFQLYQGSLYENLIAPKIQEGIKQITATYPAEALVKSREEIRAKAIAHVRAELNGLMFVDDINIANIDLTAELEKAIEAKMVQEQQALAKRFELEKERRNAEITIVKAEAEARAITIAGEALAKSPQMIELEIVKRWNGIAPQTVVVGAGGGAQVVLPIGK